MENPAHFCVEINTMITHLLVDVDIGGCWCIEPGQQAADHDQQLHLRGLTAKFPQGIGPICLFIRAQIGHQQVVDAVNILLFRLAHARVFAGQLGRVAGLGCDNRASARQIRP
jgi:hypothetical protein